MFLLVDHSSLNRIGAEKLAERGVEYLNMKDLVSYGRDYGMYYLVGFVTQDGVFILKNRMGAHGMLVPYQALPSFMAIYGKQKSVHSLVVNQNEGGVLSVSFVYICIECGASVNVDLKFVKDDLNFGYVSTDGGTLPKIVFSDDMGESTSKASHFKCVLCQSVYELPTREHFEGVI